MDYVEDDLAASDAQITEPNRADYERQEPSYFGMTRTVVDDAYYDAMDVYEEKENRTGCGNLWQPRRLTTATRSFTTLLRARRPL